MTAEAKSRKKKAKKKIKSSNKRIVNREESAFSHLRRQKGRAWQRAHLLADDDSTVLRILLWTCLL